MHLSKRLRTIANMVSCGNRVADVGCDHGYLPIWLVKQGRIPGALALDVNKEPLLRAAEHIRQHGLSQYIETRLSDGLDAVQKGEADTLVIAGMGGPLMEQILLKGRDVLDGFSEFVFGPQSELAHMRLFLLEQQFRIVEEEMVFEDGKYYTLIRAVRGSMQQLSEEELEYGPCLLAAQHPVLKQYLQREFEETGRLIRNLDQASGERTLRRCRELQRKMIVIKRALLTYE